MSIELDDLTNGISGDGVFDKLMSTLSEHLLKEFQNGRITGVNYSNVYLGGMTTVMQQSIEFLLRKDLVAKQVELTEAQTEQAKAQTDLTLKQIEIADTQIAITQKELELKEKEVEIAEQQLEKTKQEVLVLEQQVIKTQSEVALLDAKAITEKGQFSDDVTGGILKAQRDLYQAQTVGFTNDHEYKMTKVRADIYSVMLSQDPDALWNNPPPAWVLN